MIFKKSVTEKRRYKRRDCYFLIKYRQPLKESAYSEAVTSLRNLSGGGILFKSKESLPINSMLEIIINLIPGDICINTSAKVVRSEKEKGRRNYLVGATFLDIKEEDKKKITDFVEFAKEAVYE